MISSFRIRHGEILFGALNYHTKTLQKDAFRLRKLLEKSAMKPKGDRAPPKLLAKGLLPSAYQNEGLTKRVANLNKIYMEHITIMLNNGRYSSQLADLGIEISKVNLATGLNFLNIYWVPRKDGIPEDVINNTLAHALAELQEQMGDLRFTSRVPFLKFVKDVRLERELHLDKIFETADFGKDFEPIHGKKIFTEDYVQDPGDMPAMRQNVLGVNHAGIKGRIMAEIMKFKAIKMKEPDMENPGEEEEEEVHPHKLVQFSKKDFFKFFKRRRILDLKMRKRMKQQGEVYDYVETYGYQDENDDEDEYSDIDEDELEDEKFQR